MQLDIQARNYTPTARVREAVEDKAQKLLKYADVERVRCTLSEEHVDRICEVHVHTLGKDFHARAASDDMLASVDRACASLEKQLRRYKSKRDDRRTAPHDDSPLSSAAILEASVHPEPSGAEDEEA